MFDTFGPHEGAFDDPITGTLYEGHAPQVAMKMRHPPEYEATLDTAQFTLWREPVEESRWPVGKGTPPFGSLRAPGAASAYDETEK